MLIGQKCNAIDTLLGQIVFFSFPRIRTEHSDVTKMPKAFFLTTRPKQLNSSFILIQKGITFYQSNI